MHLPTLPPSAGWPIAQSERTGSTFLEKLVREWISHCIEIGAEVTDDRNVAGKAAIVHAFCTDRITFEKAQALFQANPQWASA